MLGEWRSSGHSDGQGSSVSGSGQDSDRYKLFFFFFFVCYVLCGMCTICVYVCVCVCVSVCVYRFIGVCVLFVFVCVCGLNDLLCILLFCSSAHTSPTTRHGGGDPFAPSSPTPITIPEALRPVIYLDGKRLVRDLGFKFDFQDETFFATSIKVRRYIINKVIYD